MGRGSVPKASIIDLAGAYNLPFQGLQDMMFTAAPYFTLYIHTHRVEQNPRDTRCNKLNTECQETFAPFYT